MTTLEIILIASLWIITGLWICFKRDWYSEMNNNGYYCLLAILLTPINLILVIIKEFFIRKWDNN